MANLSDLPSDIVVTIAKRLKKLEDFVSFSSVSRSLRSTIKMEYFQGIRVRQHTPYLMLPVRDGNDDVREFYSLVEGEEIVASVKVSNFKTKKCLESLGWLLATEQDGSMSLLDPFSGTEILLPHQNTFPRYHDINRMGKYIFFKKMVLSERPTESRDFVLVVICGSHGHLGFWRLGDKSWNMIESRSERYRDVVYHGGGRFYAIGNPGIVWVINFAGINHDNNYKIETRIVTYFKPHNVIPNYERGFRNVLVDFKNLYILKSSVDDSLLIITRTFPNLSKDGLSRITTKFQVYQVDLTTSTWKEIYSLGSLSVFLGYNSTTAVDASRFLGGVIKANHIYFTDDDWLFYYFEKGGMDIGVYNLETGTVEPICGRELLFSKVSPSTWITPCF